MELYSKEELIKELKKEYSCGGECDHCPEVLDAGSCSVLRCIRRIIDNIPTTKKISVIEFKEPLPLVKAQKIVKALEEKPQGNLADEVWKLYEKYHSHLATHVIEFGDELKDLLGKYQKGGADND